MSKSLSIAAKPREEIGSRAVRRLRAEGRIPAIMYGHGQEPAKLSIDQHDFDGLLRHGAHGLLDVQVDGATESAVIKDVQYDVFGREVLHVDFARVSGDERIVVEVPLVLKGTAPGVQEGGVLNWVMHSVDVECPASNIIEQLAVNISGLRLNQALLVKDLQVAEGLKIKHDSELVVVQVTPPQREVEPTEVEPTAAEPELIRREAKPDEETAEK
jgi:large subunit ribosomal protein L25